MDGTGFDIDKLLLYTSQKGALNEMVPAMRSTLFMARFSQPTCTETWFFEKMDEDGGFKQLCCFTSQVSKAGAIWDATVMAIH